jgi:transposase InsO family protein
MIKWLKILLDTFISALRCQRELAIENLALRQQLAVLKNNYPRPKLTDTDRLFWVILSKLWGGWREAIHLVQPQTVVNWHRKAFRFYWRRKSRRLGRPRTSNEIRRLIQRMCIANPLWGAPRIHGELLKLGFDISESTVSKYMIRRRKPPSQTWRVFLKNHAREIIAADFFTVPTVNFRVLFVFVILSHDRRRILHFNVTQNPTAVWTSRQLLECCGLNEELRYLLRDRDAIYGAKFCHQADVLGLNEVITAPCSPWQNPYVERVIGSIRRECLDHLIILNAQHLKHTLTDYLSYYHCSRTHLSLAKDTPDGREAHCLDRGRIVEHKKVGGLHHMYTRMAA